jgi:LPXTG-motif cell wall-anchored protein
MGEASSSAAASTGINSAGGNLTINKSNWLAWVVIGVIALLAAIVLVKRRKK